MKSPFLTQIRDVIQSRHYSIRTEKSYLYWISHYIRFHQCRHLKDMDENHIREFLAYLALQHIQDIDFNKLTVLVREGKGCVGVL